MSRDNSENEGSSVVDANGSDGAAWPSGCRGLRRACRSASDTMDGPLGRDTVPSRSVGGRGPSPRGGQDRDHGVGLVWPAEVGLVWPALKGWAVPPRSRTADLAQKGHDAMFGMPISLDVRAHRVEQGASELDGLPARRSDCRAFIGAGRACEAGEPGRPRLLHSAQPSWGGARLERDQRREDARAKEVQAVQRLEELPAPNLDAEVVCPSRKAIRAPLNVELPGGSRPRQIGLHGSGPEDLGRVP